jgi:O-antigen/teichoic acid export membrane protein
MTVQAVAIEAAPANAASRRRAAIGGTWLLSGAMVASGALTYVFHVLAARSLGPTAYGQIAVLWGAMFLSAIVLFRPVEQTASRALAARLARGEEGRSVARAAVAMASMLVVVAGVIAAAGWTTLTDRLFLGDNLMTAMLCAGVLAYALSYLVRGFLGGTRWFGGYSLGLMADAVARIAVAAPLILVASKLVAAGAVVAAGLAGALVPLIVGRRRLEPVFRRGTGEPFRLRQGLAYAGPATAIAAADQIFVNGGPLFVIAAGGIGASRSAGIVFAATMLVRAPVYVFQGLAAALLPNLTHLQATDVLPRFRSAVFRTAGFLLACGAALVAVMAITGTQLMRVLYGAGFEVTRMELVVLAAGIGLYLAASTASQALLALDEGARAATAWVISATVFVLLFFLLPGSDLARVATSFTGATLLALILLGARVVRRVR